MKGDGQIIVGSGLPDRFKVRVIQRKLIRRVDKNRQRPGLLGRALEFGERSFDVAGGDHDHALQTIRESGAVIRHPTVVSFVYASFQTNVINRRPAAEPARRQHQIDIDTFQIHVRDSHCRIAFAKRIGFAVLVALVAAHVFFALWRLFGRETQAALVLALSHQIGDGAFFIAGFIFFIVRQFIARRRRHVRFQQIGIGPNMRVGIEDFVTVTRHGCLLNAAQIAQ